MNTLSRYYAHLSEASTVITILSVASARRFFRLQCRVYRSRNDGNCETPLNLLYFLLVTVERS